MQASSIMFHFEPSEPTKELRFFWKNDTFSTPMGAWLNILFKVHRGLWTNTRGDLNYHSLQASPVVFWQYINIISACHSYFTFFPTLTSSECNLSWDFCLCNIIFMSLLPFLSISSQCTVSNFVFNYAAKIHSTLSSIWLKWGRECCYSSTTK